MTYLDYLEKKVLLERLVIGLEEPVLVKGLGELQAKIDSGNGGYNVIHGTDFHQQGNQLTFTTKDKFDHETKMTATVVDDIDVNMGGGNIEKRPVIELDIKFANEDYKKIPFSVSDRSTNTHPILISKGFVENELEALIDVGATNISNDGIDVVYGESFKDGLKKVWNGTKAVAKSPFTLTNKFANKVSDVNKTLDKVGQWFRFIGGVDENPFKSKQKSDSMVKSIKDSKDIQNNDIKIIKNDIIGLSLPKKLQNTSDVDFQKNAINKWANGNLNPENFPICTVASYMCSKGSNKDNLIEGTKHYREQWLNYISELKSKVKEEKQNRAAETVNEENEEQSIETTNPSSSVKSTIPSENKEQSVETTSPSENKTEETNPEEFKDTVTNFNTLNNFILYFISFENNENEKNSLLKAIEKIENYIESLKNESNQENQNENDSIEVYEEKIVSLKKKLNFLGLVDKNQFTNKFENFLKESKVDPFLKKLFEIGEVNPQTSKEIIKNLASLFQSNGFQGVFCLCWDEKKDKNFENDTDSTRKAFYFQDLSFVPYAKKQTENVQKETDEDEEWINKKLRLFGFDNIISH